MAQKISRLRVVCPVLLCALVACTAEEEADVAQPFLVPVSPVPPAQTVSGQLTWQIDFDDEAEAAGRVDCTYSRSYAGAEDRSSPWLCPDCELIFRADTVMPEEDLSCYQEISGTPPSVEWIGWGDGGFYRTTVEHLSLGENGEALPTHHGVEVDQTTQWYDLEAGRFRLLLSGELALSGPDDAADPYQGLLPPPSYDCGWPRSTAPTYDGSWVPEIGQQLPDGLLSDACEQGVRLWDFRGRYVVIDVSATDCPPCQVMAAEEPLFVEAMRDRFLPVEVVTLLAPSLGDVLGQSEPALLEEWAEVFDLHSAVLADRGWGYAMATRYTEGPSIAYPTSFVVAPDMTLIAVVDGYRGWAEFEDIIVNDAARR